MEIVGRRSDKGGRVMRWILAFLLCGGLLLIGLPLCQATVPLPPQHLRLELNFAADKSGWGSLQIYLPADSTEKPETFLSFFLSLIHISEPTRLGMISYAVFCLK